METKHVGKHIPLSCPLPFFGQVFLYTVIAPRCIVSSYQENRTEKLSQCGGKFSSLLRWRRHPLQHHHLAVEIWLRFRRAFKTAFKMQRRFRGAVPPWTYPAYVPVPNTSTPSPAASQGIAINQTKCRPQISTHRFVGMSMSPLHLMWGVPARPLRMLAGHLRPY